MLGLWRRMYTELYNARLFGCETEIGQLQAASPDWACCLAFLNQPEMLAIPKILPQLKLCMAFRSLSLPVVVKFWQQFV